MTNVEITLCKNCKMKSQETFELQDGECMYKGNFFSDEDGDEFRVKGCTREFIKENDIDPGYYVYDLLVSNK